MNVFHIVVAMKPLEGTFADNAFEHGVAGLNVDECRIATGDNLNGGAYAENAGRSVLTGDLRSGAALGMYQTNKRVEGNFVQPIGRWPANVILDDSEEVKAEFPSADGMAGGGVRKNKSDVLPSMQVKGGKPHRHLCRGDSGSAARFFKQVSET